MDGDLVELSRTLDGVLLEEERDGVDLLLLKHARVGGVHEPEAALELFLPRLHSVVGAAYGRLLRALEVLEFVEHLHGHVLCLLVREQASVHCCKTQG